MRHYLSHKRPLRNLNDEIIGLVGISIDITEEKALKDALMIEKEKALAASRAKSDFIANMSHDLRTPLTGISGLSEHLQLLAKQQAEQESTALDTSPLASSPFVTAVATHAADILQSAQALLAFCNTVLSVAKRDKQQAPAEQMAFRLTDLLDHQIHLFQPSAQHKGITLSYTLAPEVPGELCGPAQIIERILMNLIGNAIKFTASGFVTLTASLQTTADLPDSSDPASAYTLSIAITDTGIGIADDQQALIFEQFTRLSPSFEAVYEGSGLGLYSVSQYLSEINGSVSVESTPGIGSCFTITLPCTLPTEQAELTDYTPLPHTPLQHEAAGGSHSLGSPPADKGIYPAPKAAKGMSESGMRVLLVEDHPIAAKAASLLLQSLHCEVTHADTGELAISYAAEHPYDLILLDIGLPDIDGLAVAARIRALPGEHAATPIAALTGHADDLDTAEAAERLAISHLLTKPADMASLSALLKIYENKTVSSHSQSALGE